MRQYFQALLFLFLVGFISFFVPRSSFWELFGYYTVLFAIFLWVYIRSNKSEEILFFAIVGVIARGVAVLAFPTLSDDIYRFFWDGYLLSTGTNPLQYLPDELTGAAHVSSYMQEEIYPYLNSPNYYSIYPPVSQGIYAIAAALFPTSIQGASVVMGAFLLAAEAGSIYLLWKMLPRAGIHQKHTLLYALNPLVILETCGNLHFEGLMIFFFLAAYWFHNRGKPILFILCFSLSILTKLFTLLFLPLLIPRLGIKRFTLYGLGIIAICSCSMLPFLNEGVINNFTNSLDLYMRKFEFNASVYYLFRWVGYKVTGYNEIGRIGPLLAVMFGVSTIVIYILQWFNDKAILYRAMMIMSAYLFLSAIVHPWYLISVILLSSFTNFKYPIVWSFLIFMSYHTYQTIPYKENAVYVAIQYTALVVFILLDTGLIYPRMKREILS